MGAPDWQWLELLRGRVAAVLFLGGVVVTIVLWGDRLRHAAGLPDTFDELEEETHEHFEWAAGHEAQHSEEHEEFLEAADSFFEVIREMQTRQMLMDAMQRWMVCDEQMEDDIEAGRLPRDCPPEIIVPGGGG